MAPLRHTARLLHQDGAFAEAPQSTTGYPRSHQPPPHPGHPRHHQPATRNEKYQLKQPHVGCFGALQLCLSNTRQLRTATDALRGVHPRRGQVPHGRVPPPRPGQLQEVRPPLKSSIKDPLPPCTFTTHSHGHDRGITPRGILRHRGPHRCSVPLPRNEGRVSPSAGALLRLRISHFPEISPRDPKPPAPTCASRSPQLPPAARAPCSPAASSPLSPAEPHHAHPHPPPPAPAQFPKPTFPAALGLQEPMLVMGRSGPRPGTVLLSPAPASRCVSPAAAGGQSRAGPGTSPQRRGCAGSRHEAPRHRATPLPGPQKVV